MELLSKTSKGTVWYDLPANVRLNILTMAILQPKDGLERQLNAPYFKMVNHLEVHDTTEQGRKGVFSFRLNTTQIRMRAIAKELGGLEFIKKVNWTDLDPVAKPRPNDAVQQGRAKPPEGKAPKS